MCWTRNLAHPLWKDPKKCLESLAVAHLDHEANAGRDLFEEMHPGAAKKWREQQDGGKRKGGDGSARFMPDELDFGE